jgi:C-terminal processing protease CtpA/Prc
LALSFATIAAAFAESSRRGYLAPALPPSQSFVAGARVEEVIADTPAARAGIRAGDVIVAINGGRVADYADLDAAMAADGGRPLTVDVERGATRLRFRVAPIRALMQSPYAQVQQRWVLGVSHTEYRMVPCALEPDCE